MLETIIVTAILIYLTAKIFYILGYNLCFNIICEVLDIPEEEMDEAINKKSRELERLL